MPASLTSSATLDSGVIAEGTLIWTMPLPITVNSTLTAHKWFATNSQEVFCHNILFASHRTGTGYTKELSGRVVDDDLPYRPSQAADPAEALQAVSDSTTIHLWATRCSLFPTPSVSGCCHSRLLLGGHASLRWQLGHHAKLALSSFFALTVFGYGAGMPFFGLIFVGISQAICNYETNF